MYFGDIIFWGVMSCGYFRGEGGGKKSSLTRHLHLSVSTQPASRTPLQVSAKYAAGVATFSENVTTQLKLPINSFRLLCDRMGKFRLTH